jgi:Ion channel
METIIFTSAGAALLLLVAYDVYATVLHSSARYGPVGEGLNRAVWRVTRKLAFSLARSRRHRLLNAVGPALMPLLIITYIVLLTLAFALLYVPQMPGGFSVTGPKGDPAWLNAVYFSGCTLTTLGYGDIVPRTTGLRFVALVEAASGFALISLAITYLLAVNSALERKRTVALTLYHQAGGGADAAGFIAHHFVDGRFYGLRDALKTSTRDIQALLEAHVEHPVIHYFHPVEVYRSLPRILFLLLETCSVIRTCVDVEESEDLRNFPEVRTLEASARHVLTQLVTSLELERRMRPLRASVDENEEDESRWRRRFKQTRARLKESGIKTRADVGASWEEYREQREQWESKLERLSLYLGFDWAEVTGDRDLEEATDDNEERTRAFTLG